MKRYCFTALILLAGCITTLNASTIQSVNINYVSGTFTAGAGQYNLGSLDLADNASIVIEDYGGQQTTIDDVSFIMQVSLFEDTSANGIAKALFTDGSFDFTDTMGDSLLSANNLELVLGEPLDDMGMLSGLGTFEVTGGTLANNFGTTAGQICHISFNVDPMAMSDFSEDFSCLSNITITPLPEPITVMFLGLGATGLIWKRK